MRRQQSDRPGPFNFYYLPAIIAGFLVSPVIFYGWKLVALALHFRG